MNFDLNFFARSFILIWEAVPVTLELTFLGFLLGLVLGFFAALIQINRLPILSHLIDAVISFLRGTPAVLQIYLVYYAVPYFLQILLGIFGIEINSAEIPVLLLCIIALGLNRGAYLTSTIRSGFLSVNKGEIEAAKSIGMTGSMVLRIVILPRAFRICLPNFVSNLVNILHGSSLAFYATLIEMNGKANILAQDNWRYFETYLAAGLIYWIMTITIELAAWGLEKRITRHETASYG